MRAIISMTGALLVLLSGCAGRQALNAAPTTLAMRAGGEVLFRPDPGYAAGASLGLAVTDCCSIGTFINYTGLPGDSHLTVVEDRHMQPYVDRMLTGGVELGAVLPWYTNLGISLRAGIAGTPPTRVLMGRRGFAGSLSALYRVNARAPAAGETETELDVGLGCAVWSLGASEDSAGPDDSSASGAAFMLRLQVGADYGIELR